MKAGMKAKVEATKTMKMPGGGAARLNGELHAETHRDFFRPPPSPPPPAEMEAPPPPAAEETPPPPASEEEPATTSVDGMLLSDLIFDNDNDEWAEPTGAI